MSEVPNWINLLVASAGGFVVGISLAITCCCQGAEVSVGKRTVKLPRWAVILGSLAAAVSVVTVVTYAVVDPDPLRVGTAALVVTMFGITGAGMVKNG